MKRRAQGHDYRGRKASVASPTGVPEARDVGVTETIPARTDTPAKLAPSFAFTTPPAENRGW